MALTIYNTMTCRVDELIPGGIQKENIAEYPPVTIYCCGPTVYNYAHIGNFRTYVFNDILRRYLKFRGYRVTHAMNITDVDDKTIAGAREKGITLKEYTEIYTKIFFADLATLNIEPVEHNPLATESIDAMMDIIKKLDAKGIVYEKEGSLYFSIAKFPAYGRLSRLDAREIKSGARYDADEYEKDDVRDFALWKAAKPDETGWHTPYGTGRPGWHIECSAMVRKIFGSTIDIHTGGVDLIFPHHENEIAQSEAAYGETFVRYWIHVEHLLVDGAKMSKSKGNFYTLGDLLSKGYSARSLRYLLLSAHYRKQLNFTLEGLAQSAQALERIDNFLIRLNDVKTGSDENSGVTEAIDAFLADFTKSMDNDLNISMGLGIFFDFMHSMNAHIDRGHFSKNDTSKVLDVLAKIDSVFGFIFMKKEAATDADTIEKLIAERNAARKSRDFGRSDEIRDLLLKDGIILEDTKDGTRWKKKG